MQLKILAFGITKDIIGASHKEITVENEICVADLKKILESRYPKIRELAQLHIAVNNEYGRPDLTISESDEIALIPPVSGG